MLVTGALRCDARPAAPTGRHRNREVTVVADTGEWVAHMRGIAGRVNTGMCDTMAHEMSECIEEVRLMPEV